jgi:hypothetical protein
MLNINAVKTNPIYFRGNKGSTFVNEDGKTKQVLHQSGMFRNFDTSEFIIDYAVKNFPQGTNIVELGCSKGPKVYSDMILLDKHNQDKKYKVIGYDLIPERVEEAKGGFYLLEKNHDYYNESFLFDGAKVDREKYNGTALTDARANELKETFYKYFYTPRSTLDHNEKKYAKADYSKIPDGVVDFKVGDIRKVDEFLKPNESGVMICENTIYHLLDSMNATDYSKCNVEPAKEFFGKVHNLLPEKGVLGLGSLIYDHFFDESCEDKIHLKYQNNERIRVFDSSRVHDALREKGFEPIFYEKIPLNLLDKRFDDVHLPSVWKKVSHLK